MKYTALLTFLAISHITQSQSAEVLKKLNMFRLQTDDFVENLQAPDSACSFNYYYAFTSLDSAYLETAKFDPSKPEGEQWELLSIHNKPASKNAKSAFTKSHMYPSHQLKVMVNDSTLDNDVEGKYMIVLFHLKPETLPERYAFLKECSGKAYLNISNGKLEKVIYKSQKEIDFAGYKAERVSMEVSYVYDSSIKRYRFLREQIDMVINLNGKEAETQEVREFTGQRKVN
jgi:hypothetical protein